MTRDKRAQPDAPAADEERLQLLDRAAMHAVLGEPARLAIVDDLAVCDRSPKELGVRLHLPSNLLAHHLDVLEDVGLVVRFTSTGDRRRKYVRLVPSRLAHVVATCPTQPLRQMLFVCTANSARSQLASAMWSARTGLTSLSAGTHPARCVHPGAVDAAARAGLRLAGVVPKSFEGIGTDAQVVTVCDQAHEELLPDDNWWHWSIPDPVAVGTDAAFDATVADLDARITTILNATSQPKQARS